MSKLISVRWLSGHPLIVAGTVSLIDESQFDPRVHELVAGTRPWQYGGNPYGQSDQFRPSDPAAMVLEIRRLASTGLQAADISVALRLDHVYVMQALSGAGELVEAMP
jgi:hypothetical protein